MSRTNLHRFQKPWFRLSLKALTPSAPHCSSNPRAFWTKKQANREKKGREKPQAEHTLPPFQPTLCGKRRSVENSFPQTISRLYRVPSEIKRREVESDPQVSPEEIMSCRTDTASQMELGCENSTSFASGCSSTAVQRTLSLWLPSTAVETAIA